MEIKRKAQLEKCNSMANVNTNKFHVIFPRLEVALLWLTKVFNQNACTFCRNIKIQFNHLNNNVMNTFRIMTFHRLTYIHQAQKMLR